MDVPHLLAMRPLVGFSRGESLPESVAVGVGRADFPAIAQSSDATCWAAAGAAIRGAFGRPSLTTEQSFAEAFWSRSRCPDALANQQSGWAHEVRDLVCPIQFTELFVRSLMPLSLPALLDALEIKNSVASLLSSDGIRHVVVIYHAHPVKNGWLLSVFDPDGGLLRHDKNPEPYLSPIAVEVGDN